ncbi:MAG: insulinase family protein [Planctomycetes bacterium]|nr:insulinase family protein [Planctomycetota bacterium]
MGIEIGSQYSGFVLKEVNEIPELQSIGRLFLHEKSGAELFYLSNEDDNKTFAITFRTPPEDDKGIPHIMEHSVLCGSRKFPTKEPFTELLKGSLNTFLNAMTFSDKTMYPVASKNDKDFQNLMDVYLDAVLYPRIYDKPEILKQEGWHYEIDKADQPITYKGVVYNEMKGAFSNPKSVLGSKIEKYLFPETIYHNESGGEPEVIPEISYDEFIGFHQKLYHPSNSRIFLYGNGNIEEHLRFIDENYLHDFDKTLVDSAIAEHAPFAECREMVEEYSINPNEETGDKTYHSMSFVTGSAKDPEFTLAFNILEHILLETPASPLKNALLKANLGQEVFGFFDDSILQPVFGIVVGNSNEDKLEDFKTVVLNALKNLVETGIDPKLIDASINVHEFSLREADFHGFPKGLFYAFKSLTGWLYDDKPHKHLAYEQVLQKIKGNAHAGYFENLIKHYILDNPHSLVLTLKPKPGLSEIKDVEVAKKLEDFKAGLSADVVNTYVKETAELKEMQNAPDSPENLEKLPTLELSDINRDAEKLELDVRKENDIPVLFHPEFSNKIAYLNLYFDADSVPVDLLPYVSLLASTLGKVSTEKYHYTDLSNEMNINTGGIGFSTKISSHKDDAEQYYPKFAVSTKVLFPKMQSSAELINEIINHTRFDEKNRLKEIIGELKARMKSRIMNGFFAEYTRLGSYYSQAGKLGEIWGGITFYNFLDDLHKNFDAKFEDLTQNLRRTAQLIFNRNKLTIGFTAEEQDYQHLQNIIDSLTSDLITENISKTVLNLMPEALNEGLIIPSQVQYVIKGFNFRKLGHAYNGKLQVLRSIVSLDYFWNQVRVMGGAYGSRCLIARNGSVLFGSYRDPNLPETFSIYDKIAEYLETFDANYKEMKKYIIGTIGRIDFPMTPSIKGAASFDAYFSQLTQEDRQLERDEILATTLTDIKGFAQMMRDVTAQNVLCVLGSEKKIKDNESLFKKVINIFE